MSIYQYDQPSKLEKIAIRKTAGGGSRAFLFARDGMSAEEAGKIRQTLDNAHFACVASDLNGDSCLEVRGCKNVKLLENILRPAGILHGNPSVDHSDNERYSLGEKVRNNLVSLYGAINVVADMGIIAYGHMKQKLHPEAKGSWSDKAAGYAYSIGSMTFTAFGRGDKSDYQARDVAAKLRHELQARGVELPYDSAVISFSESRMGKGKKLANYLSKHGAEAGNIATGTAGAFMLNSARNSQQSSTKVMDGLLGATTLLSGYGAALVDEKAPDPANPPTTVPGKIKQWVQEKPNRLAGYGYMASTVIHGVETVKHYANAEKEYPGKVAYARKAYAFRGAFTVLNLIGEFMLASASKGHGSGVRGNSTIEDTALAIVADAIVRQPPADRAGLIADLGTKFLTNPDVLGGDAVELQSKLSARVQKLENNPWLIRKTGQAVQVKDGAAQGFIAQQQATSEWAKGKVQNLAAMAKAENHVAAIDKSREAASERVL